MNSELFFDRLASVSIQTTILVLVVFMVTRLLALSPRVRTFLWTLVFAHSLVGMFFSVPLPLVSGSEPETFITGMVPRKADHEARMRESRRINSGGPDAISDFVDVKGLLVGIWLTGVAGMLGVQLRRERKARGRLSGAREASDSVQAIAQGVAREMGVRQLHVRMSPLMATPCVAGLIRPTVYLPEGLEHAEPDHLRAVFVHELAHVRHGDLPASVLASAARCLLFFHPMSWVAHREWSIQREAACDAEVLRRSQIGVAAYCDLLIQFAQGRPLLSATIQAATRGFSHLHRRICEMKNTQPKKRGAAPVATIAALVVSALAAIPVTVTARDAMTHRPAHASGPSHSITPGKDGPTLGVGPDDSVSVQTLDNIEETDPVLERPISLSLKDASFAEVVAAIEKVGNIDIITGNVKTNPISLQIEANVATSLTMVADLAKTDWHRVDDRTFRLSGAPKQDGDPVMLPSDLIANPTMISSDSIAKPEMLPSGSVVDPVMLDDEVVSAQVGMDAVDAFEILPKNKNDKIRTDVIFLFGPGVSEKDAPFYLEDVPKKKGTYFIIKTEDEKGKARFTTLWSKEQIELTEEAKKALR